MTPNLVVLLSSLVGLFSLIAVGYIAVKFNILPRSVSTPLSTLLMKIILPANLFISMLRPLDPNFIRASIIIVLLCQVSMLLFSALSKPLAQLFRVDTDRRGVWQFCSIAPNNGFMGYPVIFALFGEEGLALAAITSLPYTLTFFSIGIRMVCKDSTSKQTLPSTSLRGILFTAVNFSIFLGLIFYIFQIQVPSAVLDPLQHLANMTTPLSMIITGMNLAGSPLRAVFCDRNAITASFARLLLFPLLLLALLHALPIDPLVINVLMVLMAMPTAAIAAIFGERYEAQKEFAARTISLSSLLCIITIPLITMLL